jgi:hypothetical protein
LIIINLLFLNFQESEMAPPSAAHIDEIVDSAASVHSNGHEDVGTATHEPGLTKKQTENAEIVMPKLSVTKKFEDPYEERAYQKGRLALAFRIFAKFGFDEGVAGHITLRVSATSQDLINMGNVGWRACLGAKRGYMAG